MSTKISSSNIQAGALVNFSGPKVTGIAYPADDTAADPAGAQTIILIGSGFEAGLTVYLGGSVVGVSSVVSSTQVTFVAPVKAAGNYSLILVNLDGGTATFVPGIQYSGTPTWSTASGSLATVYETAAISNSLSALSDSAVTYSVESGTLPTGATLFAGNGLVSGTAPVVASSTTYNFTVTAKDGENQDTARNFSYTVNPDAVTWSTPAAGATLSGTSGTAYTQALSATSAAGRAITYTANALPAGLSISGASITGTPGAASSISTLLTATAATTGRTATRTVAWSVAAASVSSQAAYTTAGTYSWTAPAGVTSVSVVAVGGGGGGGERGEHVTNGSSGQGGSGGGLGWKNNIAVTPGQSYTVVVGGAGAGGAGYASNDGAAGGNSYFISTSTVCGFGGPGGYAGSNLNVGTSRPGGSYAGDGGGAGGAGGTGQRNNSSPLIPSGGGGGAGGYSGTGGAGGTSSDSTIATPGLSGTGGAAGGGSSAVGQSPTGGTRTGGGGGGGVGLLGQGTSGGGTTTPANGLTYGGKGGSGGANALDNVGSSGSYTPGSDGGLYGGGGGGHGLSPGPRPGAAGAVRIIWGTGRAFPSTRTANE